MLFFLLSTPFDSRSAQEQHRSRSGQHEQANHCQMVQRAGYFSAGSACISQRSGKRPGKAYRPPVEKLEYALKEALENVFNNRAVIDGSFKGLTKNNYLIEMHIRNGKVATFYFLP
jgi:hypothetical protein